MKPSEAKKLIDRQVKRGWVKDGNIYRTPAEAAALGLDKPKRKTRTVHVKTGWIDDTRNIANREKQVDTFITLCKTVLSLEVWPEFFFSTEREYRFDYAIPVAPNLWHLRIAIEVEGGIWSKGNSGHSSGTGIKRDMEKSTLANINGWTLIRCTPDEIRKEPGRILSQIEAAMKNILKNY